MTDGGHQHHAALVLRSVSESHSAHYESVSNLKSHLCLGSGSCLKGASGPRVDGAPGCEAEAESLAATPPAPRASARGPLLSASEEKGPLSLPFLPGVLFTSFRDSPRSSTSCHSMVTRIRLGHVTNVRGPAPAGGRGGARGRKGAAAGLCAAPWSAAGKKRQRSLSML